MMEAHEAELWVRFAAGALADKRVTTTNAAVMADELMTQFHARFRERRSESPVNKGTFLGWSWRTHAIREAVCEKGGVVETND